MEIKSIGQIIAGVCRAREWFESIGVSTSRTRLEEIEKYLHEILNHRNPDTNPFNAYHQAPEAYQILSDAASFVRIATGLESMPSHLLPRGVLRDSLRGPIALSAESNPNATDPRNKFVELELAAHCSHTRLDIVDFDDLKFIFEGTRYVIECKRPFSPNTLEANIEKAYDQICKRLEEGNRGIVAIAVEKVFHLDGRFHEIESADDLSRIAKAVAVAFRNRVSKYEYNWLDSRVVGILAIIRFLAKLKSSDQVVYSYQLALIKFASEHMGQPSDSLRLDRLTAVLRS